MKYTFVLLILALLTCTDLAAQNLITNPGFEEELSSWNYHTIGGSSANISIESTGSPEGNNHLKCEVQSLGTNDWDIQLKSNEFATDESHQYRLTFKGKSGTSGSELKVYIQKNSWIGKNFILTDTWETFTYEFFQNEASKELRFNFVELADYYIDDIVLEDITPINTDFNTPPSCVITAPHVNAYVKQGSEVVINAYATDIGGSGLPGEISKLEFFVDGSLIGSSTTGENKTYSCHWEAGTVGEYRLTAKATDNLGKSFTSAGVLVTVGFEKCKSIGLSAGKGKYLGCVVSNSGVPDSFTEYWNGVTSGNGGKWQTVERNRDVMNWQLGDEAYNLALENNLPYRYHTLAWGSQYPNWITTLEPAEFQEEMEEFISAVADRYPYLDQIDVINETLPGHQEATQYFIDGLGGEGESGYDWAVWLFKKAREYFPNAKLVLNDFAMVSSKSNIREQLLLLRVLRDSALLDGFGAQAHTFNLDNMQAADLQDNLDLMAEAGVPVYITEMDMQGKNTSESSQLSSYKNLFPVLWEHPDIAGITLWGYIYNNMWKPYAGLVYDNGDERSSMVWLKEYMNEQENVGYPSVGINKKTASASDSPVSVLQESWNGNVRFHNRSWTPGLISIYDVSGRKLEQFNLAPQSNEIHTYPAGVYIVNIHDQESIMLIVK